MYILLHSLCTKDYVDNKRDSRTKNRQHHTYPPPPQKKGKGQKDNQRSTKHYTENIRSSNTTPSLPPKKTHTKEGVNWGATEDLTVPAPLVTGVVLLLKDSNIIWRVNRIGTTVYVNEYKNTAISHEPPVCFCFV